MPPYVFQSDGQNEPAPDERPIADQGQPVLPRGDVAPAEGPVKDQQDGAPGHDPDYGPNNEQLPEDLQTALRELVKQVTAESEIARREEIRRVKQAHYFWRGLHYLWWSERDQNWHLPFEQKLTDQTSIEDTPRYEFVTNIYQAFGQSVISVLSQSVPHVRFLPKSPSSELDVATARAASDVTDLVERNNNIEQRMAEEAFYLWVGGKVGAYVRYVVDGQAFGWHPEPKIEAREKQLEPARYACQACGAETPEAQIRRIRVPQPGQQSAASAESALPNQPAAIAGLRNLDSGMEPETTAEPVAAENQAAQPPIEALFCPECGARIEAGNWLPAKLMKVPEVTGTLNVPNGQEMLTMVGALELKTPPWAGDQREYPYLQWQIESHVARLRAAYPHAAGRIGQPVVSDASSQYERLARLTQSQGGPFTQGGDINQNLITFQRTWLRPWAFYLLEDKDKRERLLTLFPEGCYVAFAAETYCESRNESLDDHWRVMHAMPGDGSATGRPGIGDSLISVQERFNTLTNMQMETYDFGVPATYIDPEAIDVEASQYQSAEPGALYPARPRPGMPLGASFFSPPPASVPPDLVEHTQELMGPIAQFLTGAFPAMFGGSMEGQKTASGYAMARDQAMGRLGLVWRRMRQFHADIMTLAVECFRKNRSTDVEIPLMGEGAEINARSIKLADLKGNIIARPEADDQFPTMWNQKRGVLLQLMGMADPQIQQTLAMPENLALVKSLVGLTELKVPGEAARAKATRTIGQLLESQPLMISGPQQPNGEPGQTVTLPSIMPDAFADDHAVTLETVKGWLISDAGQAAQTDNPQGWANVRAYGLVSQQMLQKQQMQAGKLAAMEKAGPKILENDAKNAGAPKGEKPPSTTINFKDLPPDGQRQAAHEAGIELTPQDVGMPEQAEPAGVQR